MAFLLGLITVYRDPAIITLIFALSAVLIGWMMIANPITGIRIDNEALTLNAWRRPREIPLHEIDHLRVTDWTDECDIVIVYRDGREEGTHAADMPDPDTLAEVMALHGIPVRDGVVTL